MAKKLKPFRRHLNRVEDLITTAQNTRAGFIAQVLERNRRATPALQFFCPLKFNAGG
jgi:hypothetical protein